MRLFRIGCIVMVLTCFIHLIGHFSNTPPANDSEKTMLELMNNYRLPIGITMMDLFKGFSLYFSLFLLFFGLTGFLFVNKMEETVRQSMMWVYAGFGAGMTILSFAYFFAAPTACITTGFVFVASGAIMEKIRPTS